MENKSDRHDSLRKNAEASLVHQPSTDITPLSAEKLLYELQAHQVELEMQNEELRRAQVELEKSRDRYVDFYDFAPVGYLTLSHGGMIDEINLTGAAMIGVERNKLPYRRFANFVATEDRDRWHRYFLDVLKSDDTLTCELTLQHDGGSCLYVRLDCLCLKKGSKESVVRVVLSDAQLEKNHRQALKDLEHQKFALDQHSIVAITDVSGTITYVNDKFCMISQYSRDELLGQNHRLINSGIHPKEFFHEMFRTIASGKVWHGEICNRAKDGSLYWVETTIVPNMGSDGKPFQYVAMRTDVTERKKAEEASVAELKQAVENLRLFVKQAPISIAMFDNAMNYLATSDHWIADYGRGHVDLVGRNHYVVHPDVQDEWKKVHQQCLLGATLKNDHELWVRSDGSRHWLSWVVLPWCYSDGKIGGIIISTEDITERKLIEQELIDLNNRLSREVAKRTSELSALTAHIQKVAETERANLARELHDELGSTLVGLSMEVGHLKGKISTPELLQHLSIIKDLISNASNIKQNIINQLYPTILDDYGLVAAVDWLVKEYRRYSGIAVELVMPKEDIVLEHPVALAAYRITQECLTNIAKHAGASKIHIEAKAGDGVLDLTIHDNGNGLPDDIKTRGHGIFGMIERARYLGGSMEIVSQKKNGTTAHLILPSQKAN